MCICTYGQFKDTELADSSCFSPIPLIQCSVTLILENLELQTPQTRGRSALSLSVQARRDQKPRSTLRKSGCRDAIVSYV